MKVSEPSADFALFGFCFMGQKLGPLPGNVGMHLRNSKCDASAKMWHVSAWQQEQWHMNSAARRQWLGFLRFDKRFHHSPGYNGHSRSLSTYARSPKQMLFAFLLLDQGTVAPLESERADFLN